MYDCTYNKVPIIVKLIETENRKVVTRGCGRGGRNEELFLMGIVSV